MPSRRPRAISGRNPPITPEAIVARALWARVSSLVVPMPTVRPATVAVLVKEQTWTNWQALSLSRTNLYAGDVYLPLGFLALKLSNAADAAAAALPAQSVHSSYYFYNNGQAGGVVGGGENVQARGVRFGLGSSYDAVSRTRSGRNVEGRRRW